MGECFSSFFPSCFERRAEVTTSTPSESNKTFIITGNTTDSLTNSSYLTTLGSPAERSSSQDDTLTQDMFSTPCAPSNTPDNTQCITVM